MNRRQSSPPFRPTRMAATGSLRRRYGDAIPLDRCHTHIAERVWSSSKRRRKKKTFRVPFTCLCFFPNQCTNDGFPSVCISVCFEMWPYAIRDGWHGSSNWELQSAWQDLCWASQQANKRPYMHACMHVQSARPLNPSNCRCFMLHCCAGPACTQ